MLGVKYDIIHSISNNKIFNNSLKYYVIMCVMCITLKYDKNELYSHNLLRNK